MRYEKERKKVISYCGDYCLRCDWYMGRIKEPADQLLVLIKKRLELKGWIKGGCNPDNFIKGLEWLSKSGFCTYTCKGGSGWGGCPVRKCCEEKGFSFCFECEEFPCKKWGKWPFDQEKIQNLRKIKEVGVETWIKKQWKEAL